MSLTYTEWCGECGHYVFTSPLRTNTRKHTQHKEHESMSEYYVNYGRWNDHLVGPFEDHDVAQAYAAQHNMTSKPSVCAVRAPDPLKLATATDACKRTFYVTFCRRSNTNYQIKLVILATSERDARDIAWSDLGVLGNELRHVVTREV